MMIRLHFIRWMTSLSLKSPIAGLRRGNGRMVMSATLVVGLIIGSVMSTSTPSWASASSRTKSANGSAFCKLVRSVSFEKKFSAANDLLSTVSTESEWRVADMKFQAMESLVQQLAPNQLQMPYRMSIADMNQEYAILEKVKFQHLKLTKSVVASLTKYIKLMIPLSATIQTYSRKVCGY